MKVVPLGIKGAWLMESRVWPDERGLFREWFKREEILMATGLDFSVQQANFSLSNKGVIRGIHYSLAADGQAKLVTCVSGSILDVIVDIRPNSPTFRKVEYIILEPDNGKSVLVGPGLGHGFIAQKVDSGITYLLSSPYSPNFEYDISPTDSELNIEWNYLNPEISNLILSDKDRVAPNLSKRQELGQLPRV
jgi:dTDP-4-dehydrorhamnose 3,5-epimerase